MSCFRRTSAANNDGRRGNRTATVLAAATVVLLPVALAGPTGAANGVEVHATVDNQDLGNASPHRPARLQDDHPAVMNVRVANSSANDVLVRSVRLRGRVIGLTMFSYEARVDLRVAPATTEEVTYEIELVDLSRQAVGFIPARVELLDAKRHVLATQLFESDVAGSARSVYGLFGVIVAGITIVLFVSGLARLAAHRLPSNRWKRAVRFGVVGLGFGLTVTFTSSAFGILFPSPGLWVTLLLLGGGGMLLFGYLTPSPDDVAPDDDARAEEAFEGAHEPVR
jgi:hypothetical protein